MTPSSGQAAAGDSQANDPFIIALDGKLVLGAPISALRDRVDKALQTPARTIVVDLSRVSYVDSAGLGALALSFHNAKNSGRAFKIAGPQPNVKQALGITRLDSVIPIVASVS